ncbi:MFS transporter [Streptomyces odontomachi]|uniref:MFS transporter n=1 Tax=Streptomyces odontomachi TaxID=2944940 RepID=UPI00210B8EE2|nr:MFS transporter [Streptomyces sp. ODS25]
MSATTTPSSSGATPPNTRQLAVVAGASLIGTAVEWYDFFLYGTAAALVFPEVFFPDADPVVGTLLSLSTYAIGFVARPLGAAVLGNMGDRKGRKGTLIWTLLVMGVATFLIACLPGYGTIGVAAPILLLVLRLVQGFALGGEWGGSILIAAEHSTAKARAFWTSFPATGPSVGNLMAAGVLAILQGVMSDGAFIGYGWRIAFALSALLVVIGLLLRNHVAETPMFQRAARRREPAPGYPVADAFRYHWRRIILAVLLRFGDNVSFYLFGTYVLSYVTGADLFSKGTALTAVTISMACCAVALPMFAVIVDRRGRKPVLIASGVSYVIWPWAGFALIDSGGFAGLAAAVIVAMLAHALFNAVNGPIYAELFPTEVRYSAMSVAYNISAVLAGSLAPIIAVALYAHYGSSLPIAGYAAGMGLIATIASLFTRETRNVDMEHVVPDPERRPAPDPHEVVDPAVAAKR